MPVTLLHNGRSTVGDPVPTIEIMSVWCLGSKVSISLSGHRAVRINILFGILTHIVADPNGCASLAADPAAVGGSWALCRASFQSPEVINIAIDESDIGLGLPENVAQELIPFGQDGGGVSIVSCPSNSSSSSGTLLDRGGFLRMRMRMRMRIGLGDHEVGVDLLGEGDDLLGGAVEALQPARGDFEVPLDLLDAVTLNGGYLFCAGLLYTVSPSGDASQLGTDTYGNCTCQSGGDDGGQYCETHLVQRCVLRMCDRREGYRAVVYDLVRMADRGERKTPDVREAGGLYIRIPGDRNHGRMVGAGSQSPLVLATLTP